MTTRNLVPRADNEGKLGTSAKRWSDINAATGSFSTLKVSSLKLNAVADLDLLTSGAGIETITTNNDSQFVIALDDTFLTDRLGFNADGTKPNFTLPNGDPLPVNTIIAAGDSLVDAIEKLNNDLRNVAAPSNLTVASFAATSILSGSETFVDDDSNLMTAAAIDDRILSYGYTTNTGDITSVSGSNGIELVAGDGSSGDIALRLIDTAVTAGSYGSATQIPTFTVDAKGRLTAAANQAISTSFTLSADNGEDDTFNTGEILHFSGSTGKISTTVSNNIITTDLVNTAVTIGSYGSATEVSTFTVDQQGRLTAANKVAISIPSSQVNNFTESVQDAVAFQLVTNGSHTGISASYDDAGDGAIDLSINSAVITSQDVIENGLQETDEFLLNDGGTLKRMDLSVLKTYFDRGGDGALDFTTNTDSNVSIANLETRLGEITGSVSIGANSNVTVTIPGNLTVQGTQTVVDTVTMNAQNAIVFEGFTADDNETTLSIIDPTANHTIYLPNQSGYLPVLSDPSTTQITATPEELNYLSGSSPGTSVASKAVIYNADGKVVGDLVGNADTSSKWSAERTITFGTGEVTGTFSIDGSANVQDIALTISGNSVTNEMLAGAIEDDKLDADYIQASEVDDSSIEFTDGTLNVKALGITNAMLAGSIADGKLASDYIQTSEVDDSSIEFIGGTLNVKALGITNAMLAGSISNDKLAGSIADGKLASDYIQTSEVDDSSIEFTDGTLNVKALGITDAMLAGSISNDKLSTLTSANKVSLSALDIDGGTLIAALAAEDLLIVDDGGLGINRKATIGQLITLFNGNNSFASFPSLASVGTITTGTWNAGIIADAYISDTLTITSGSIDDAAIGENQRSSGKFTTLDANTSLTLKTVTINSIKDEDNMASDAADALATQQSIKAYVDNQLSGHCLFVAADNTDGANDLINVSLANNEKLEFIGGYGIDTTAVETEAPATNDTITIDIDSSIVATLTGSQTLTNKTLVAPIVTDLYVSGSSVTFEGATNNDFELTLQITEPTADVTLTLPNATDTLVGKATADILTNKTINADNNTISNLVVDNLKNGVLDTDLSAVSANNDTLASAKAVKTYVDQQLGRFGGIFLTDSADNGKAAQYNRDVIFDSSPLVRSHFGPFAFDLGQLYSSGGSDIIFFGATATGASDRHFLVIGSGDDAGDTKFTGANENTP